MKYEVTHEITDTILMKQMRMVKQKMEDHVFELLTKMYSEMNNRFDKVEKDIFDVKNEVFGVKNEVLKINMRIENDIIPKTEALFDGYKQNTEQLTRIEAEVTKHEEVILRRIK